MEFLIDPDRERPNRIECYNTDDGTEPCEAEHEGWRHATSWDEVQQWLKLNLEVVDQDGDKIREIHTVPQKRYELIDKGTVILTGGGRYDYTPYQILLEDLELIQAPTPEEEAGAMASIMEAFSNNRLS